MFLIQPYEELYRADGLRFLLGRLQSVILGLFAGAMLFILSILCPYWLALPPLQFKESFIALAPYLGPYMLSLLAGSIFLSLGNVLYQTFLGQSFYRGLFILGLLVGIVILYGAIHAPLNTALLHANDLQEVQLLHVRDQWVLWHGVRTLLGLIAFWVALFQGR